MFTYFKNRKLVKQLAELESKCDRMIDQIEEGKRVLNESKIK